MASSTTTQREKTGRLLVVIGLMVMALMTITQFFPLLRLAGYSIFAGIAFFFIVETVTKTPSAESGLRFKTFFTDLKKPGVLPWVLLPIVTALATLFVGDLIFSGGFSTHVLGRTGSMLSFDKIPQLVVQVIIAALGEEIAWRGFFVGKSMQRFPFWLCAVASSVFFAMGHIASGEFWLVLYDVSLIFVDSIIYAIIYRKTGNCLISTVSHILCNAVGIFATLILL